MSLANPFSRQSAMSKLLGVTSASKPATVSKSAATSPKKLGIPALPGWMSTVPEGQSNPFAAPSAPVASGIMDVVGGNATQELLKKLRQNQGLMAALGGGESGGYTGIMSTLGLR